MRYSLRSGVFVLGVCLSSVFLLGAAGPPQEEPDQDKNMQAIEAPATTPEAPLVQEVPAEPVAPVVQEPPLVPETPLAEEMPAEPVPPVAQEPTPVEADLSEVDALQAIETTEVKAPEGGMADGDSVDMTYEKDMGEVPHESNLEGDHYHSDGSDEGAPATDMP